MMAAIFSATMSSLNSEFNIMSGVLTNDIYKRLLNPNGSDQHYLWIARINMIVVGVIATVGALYVGKLGGAFEANKILTGLFAIPLAIPLIFGILSKKPRPIGALATVVLGMLSGLLLNAHPDISWEMATFIEIIICFIVFFSSGFFISKSIEYKKRVQEFFVLVNTPLSKEEIPEISPKLLQMLYNVFILSLSIGAILIFSMALFSLGTFGSRIAMVAAIFFILLAVILYIINKKMQTKVKKESF